MKDTSIATKVSPGFAAKVAASAKSRNMTVSKFLRTAAENEIQNRPAVTFGERFGHLAGVAKGLPRNLSSKEGYALSLIHI